MKHYNVLQLLLKAGVIQLKMGHLQALHYSLLLHPLMRPTIFSLINLNP